MASVESKRGRRIQRKTPESPPESSKRPRAGKQSTNNSPSAPVAIEPVVVSGLKIKFTLGPKPTSPIKPIEVPEEIKPSKAHKSSKLKQDAPSSSKSPTSSSPINSASPNRLPSPAVLNISRLSKQALSDVDASSDIDVGSEIDKNEANIGSDLMEPDDLAEDEEAEELDRGFNTVNADEEFDEEINDLDGDEEEIEEDDEDDDNWLNNSTSASKPLPSQMTARQQVLLKSQSKAARGNTDMDIVIPTPKEVLSEEALLKRSEMARRRKTQAAKRSEEMKSATIQKLLRKQTSKKMKLEEEIRERRAEEGERRRGPRDTIQYLSSQRRPNSLSLPEDVELPPLPPSQYPAVRICSICSQQPRKYQHRATGVPVCSLECYTKVPLTTV